MLGAFGEVLLDTDRRELRRGGVLVSLEPQAFDVLVYLVTHRDRVVPKEELMDMIWGGRFVSEAAVTSRIKQARRAVGDDGQTQAVIRTSHGRGYRFIAEMADPPAGRLDPAPSRAEASVDVLAPILFARADHVTIAYRITGQGPPDIVLLTGPAPSLAEQDEDPAFRAFVGGLGLLGRVLRFDPRGTGLSPSRVPPTDLQTVDRGTLAGDVLAVLDDAASERAVVFGAGAGGSLAATLAAIHPERAAALVLYGTDARSLPAALLASIEVPTLVMHRTDDEEVPVEAARVLAARIPAAEYVELDGEEHSVAHASAQILESMEDLVEEAARAQAPTRSLAALVGLAGSDPSSLADVLKQLGGVRRRGPQNALLVSFDGPATAMRALGSRRARGLLQSVGVAVAIDEVSSTSTFVAGHGVDVARLVACEAEPGEVLMPNVIKDLLAGSGLVVEPAGTLDLAHVGPHRIYRWRH